MLKSYSENAPLTISDVLLYEIDPRYSRETGELAPLAEKLPIGAVLSLNDDGQYAPYGAELTQTVATQSDDESAPAQTAATPVAILISRGSAASENPQQCAVIRRGACVWKQNLYWLPTITDEQKTTALAALESLGILPKE